MQLRTSIGAFAALFLMHAAHADDSGPYLGVGIGYAQQTGDDLEDGDTAYKALVGYTFNRVLSVEVSHIDAGRLRDTTDGIDLEVAAHGYQAAVVARLPVTERFSPYAKLGYIWYDTRTTASSGNTSFTESTSDSDASYGFGIDFQLGKHFRLRGEYEYIDVPDVDFDLLSLVAVWQF